jgi:hypothetical protein
MCLVGETLYVADTENHVIRAVDLKAEKVMTVAGTGHQNRGGATRGPARTTPLTSPWDVLPIPNSKSLAIAMAGCHQIWRLDLDKETVSAWAGSGTEDIADGSAAHAAFAQPSGLATDGHSIYIADSESSGLRAIPVVAGRDHSVHTIVGTYGDLFSNGDVDGQGPEVRLQHCLGVAWADGALYVADTYNNKVKVCNPKEKTVRTFVGSHEAGDGDDPPQFDEPGGLSAAGSTLYVADTNNHAIRAVDLKTKKVTTLALADVKPPAPAPRRPKFLNAVTLDVPGVRVRAGREFRLDVGLALPEGFKVNPDESMPYLVETPGAEGVLSDEVPASGQKLSPPKDAFTVRVPLSKPTEVGQTIPLRLSVMAYICREGKGGLCTIKSYVWNVPVTFAEDAPDRVELTTKK